LIRLKQVIISGLPDELIARITESDHGRDSEQFNQLTPTGGAAGQEDMDVAL
jgi:hypothetical protein